MIEIETPHVIHFKSNNDVQYFRFKSDKAGIYNFNYETNCVATTIYTVDGGIVYADIPAGSFSPNLPANTFFELRVRCNPYVEEESLTVVPPTSGGSTDDEEDSKHLTGDDVESVVIKPIEIYENTYGHWQRYFDEETGENLYYCYTWGSFLSYTITLKNGDVIEAPEGYFEYDGIHYAGVDLHAHKDYEERWLVGNTYTEKTTI